MSDTTYSHGKVASSSNKKNVGGTLTMWALILMSVNFSGSFGASITNFIEIGYTEAPAFLAACFLYLFPFTFIIIEFVSLTKTKGNKSGMMGWVKVGAGRKLAFLTAFMFWFANLTYFMGSLPTDVNNMFYTILGKDVTTNPWYMKALPWIMVGMFALVTWLSVKGTGGMAFLITLGGSVFLIFLIIFLVVSTGAWFGMSTNMLDGYGGISEGGFYLNNINDGYSITVVNDGIWVPVGTNLEFNSLEDATSFMNAISGDGFTVSNSAEGIWNITGSSRDGVEFSVEAKWFNDSSMLHFDHTYTSAQNPFIINNELLNSDTQDKILFGNVGGMNWLWFSTFVWVIMACDGMQGYAVFADDVKGGRKNFSRALIIGALITGTLYTFGMFFVSVFPGNSLSNATQTTEGLMFYFLFGNLFGMDKELVFQLTFRIIGAIKFTAAMGSLILWTAAPVRTLFNDSGTGMFGSWVTKKNDHGVPYRGAWLQFWIMVPLLVGPYLMISFGGSEDAVNNFMEMVKTAGGSLGMIPPMFIFFAYFNLRLKNDREDRTFRMGSRGFGLAISGMLLVVYTWIFLMSFFPYVPGDPSWVTGTILNSVALLFVFFPLLFYYLWFENKQKNLKIAIQNGVDPYLIAPSYVKDDIYYTRFNRDLFEAKILEKDKLKDKYDKIYLKTAKDSQVKEYKSNMKAVDSQYKAESKLIDKKYKKLFAERKSSYRIAAKDELSTIADGIHKYKYGFKEDKAKLKEDYKKKLNTISNEIITPEAKAEFKAAKIELLAKQKIELQNEIDEFNSEISEKVSHYKTLIKETHDKDKKLILKAEKDDYVANRKLDLRNRKYYWADKHSLQLIELEGKYLGTKIQLQHEIKHSIKWAKEHSYKKEIESLDFTGNVIYNELENINFKGTETFDAIRSYTADRKISKLTDALVISKTDLILISKDLKSYSTYSINLNIVEIIEDPDHKSINVLSAGKVRTLYKFRIVHYDQFIQQYEDWFVEDISGFKEAFYKAKAKIKPLSQKEMLHETEL